MADIGASVKAVGIIDTYVLHHIHAAAEGNKVTDGKGKIDMKELVLANISNGLCYEHSDLCYFQSCHGHKFKDVGYFSSDAMPYKAIVHLFNGGIIKIIDATANDKAMSDAQKFGVPTWCLVFNRALKLDAVRVCSWQTREMYRAAHSDIHKKLCHSIRKLARYYSPIGPAIIDRNVFLECHRLVDFDDKPELIRAGIDHLAQGVLQLA